MRDVKLVFQPPLVYHAEMFALFLAMSHIIEHHRHVFYVVASDNMSYLKPLKSVLASETFFASFQAGNARYNIPRSRVSCEWVSQKGGF